MNSSSQNDKFLDIKAAIIAEPVRFFKDPDILLALNETLDTKNPQGDNIYDIRDQVIARIRQEFTQLKKQHNDVITTVRDNFTATLQIHNAVLQLIKCQSLEAFLTLLKGNFFDILRVNAGLFIVAQNIKKNIDASIYENMFILSSEKILSFQQGSHQNKIAPIILRPIYKNNDISYGKGAHNLVSEVLLSFCEKNDGFDAVFAMASISPDQFSAGQNTDFLAFFRESLGHMLRSWLKQ